MERHELESSTAAGVYTPSSFLIKYFSPTPLREILGSDEEYVVLHEFIHFLQDISTPYGCMNLCNYYNRLQYGLNQIVHSRLDPVILPIPLVKSAEVQGASEIFSLVWGNTGPLNKKSGQALLMDASRTIGGHQIRYYELVVDGVGYVVGAKDVLESMAYIIERQLYGEKSPPSFFPYKTVEYLAGILTPDISDKPLILCALCELSLLSSNPAAMLIDCLRKIQKEKRIVTTLEDAFIAFNSDLTFSTNEAPVQVNADRALDYAFSEAIRLVQKPFGIEDFNKLNNWTSELFSGAKKMRKRDALFITRGMESKDPSNYYFGYLVSEIGCPTIMNSHLEPMTIEHPHNTNQVNYLHAVKELSDIVFTGKKKCDLYVGCLEECKTNNGAYAVTDECYTQPWKKGREERLCPLGKLFYTWGISGREFQVKSSNNGPTS